MRWLEGPRRRQEMIRLFICGKLCRDSGRRPETGERPSCRLLQEPLPRRENSETREVFK